MKEVRDNSPKHMSKSVSGKYQTNDTGVTRKFDAEGLVWPGYG
jgi:hypothetical protein